MNSWRSGAWPLCDPRSSASTRSTSAVAHDTEDSAAADLSGEFDEYDVLIEDMGGLLAPFREAAAQHRTLLLNAALSGEGPSGSGAQCDSTSRR